MEVAAKKSPTCQQHPVQKQSKKTQSTQKNKKKNPYYTYKEPSVGKQIRVGEKKKT